MAVRAPPWEETPRPKRPQAPLPPLAVCIQLSPPEGTRVGPEVPVRPGAGGRRESQTQSALACLVRSFHITLSLILKNEKMMRKSYKGKTIRSPSHFAFAPFRVRWEFLVVLASSFCRFGGVLAWPTLHRYRSFGIAYHPSTNSSGLYQGSSWSLPGQSAGGLLSPGQPSQR